MIEIYTNKRQIDQLNETINRLKSEVNDKENEAKMEKLTKTQN